MRRTVLLVLLALVSGYGLMAQDAFQELSGLINLDASLKAVNTDPALLESLVRERKLVLFTGTVASRTVINADEENFVGELELIDGEWHGTSSVAMFRSYLRLEGPRFFGTIPVRRTRQKDPREIEPNTRFIVIGELIDTRSDESGSYPVVRVEYLRQI